MGVIVGWQSSASVAGSLAGGNSIPCDQMIGLGPRSADNSGFQFKTQVGAPVYVLAYGFYDPTGSQVPVWTYDVGWTLAYSYWSSSAVNATVAALFKLPAYSSSFATFHWSCSHLNGNTSGISMAPYCPLGPGQSLASELIVGTEAFANSGASASLVSVSSVGTGTPNPTMGFLLSRSSDAADLRDSPGASPHFFEGPVFNASSNRGITGSWNLGRAATGFPPFYVGPGGASLGADAVFAVAFATPQECPFTAGQVMDATRVKPEYRPRTFESGGGIWFE